LFRRAARAFGGIVLPPLWLGPDRRAEEGEHAGLIGMDYAPTTDPHRQLPGSLYWVPKEFFHQLVEAVLAQAKRAGFACVVADGHGPSRWAFGESVDAWELQFDLKLVSVTRDFPEGWQSQVDHAGKNETSILLAAAPNLVDMSLLPEDRDIQPEGTSGGSSDPRDASPEHGETCLETSLALIGKKLDELGI
jgi:creatinine amidohydrolase